MGNLYFGGDLQFVAHRPFDGIHLLFTRWSIERDNGFFHYGAVLVDVHVHNTLLCTVDTVAGVDVVHICFPVHKS